MYLKHFYTRAIKYSNAPVVINETYCTPKALTALQSNESTLGLHFAGVTKSLHIWRTSVFTRVAEVGKVRRQWGSVGLICMILLMTMLNKMASHITWRERVVFKARTGVFVCVLPFCDRRRVWHQSSREQGSREPLAILWCHSQMSLRSSAGIKVQAEFTYYPHYLDCTTSISTFFCMLVKTIDNKCSISFSSVATFKYVILIK